MECGFDKNLLTLWLNGEITEKERAEVEAHLAGCETCRQELSTGEHLWELMESIPTPEPPAGTLVRFNAMLDAYKDSEEASTSRTAPVQKAPTRTTSEPEGPGLIARLKQLFTL